MNLGTTWTSSTVGTSFGGHQALRPRPSGSGEDPERDHVDSSTASSNAECCFCSESLDIKSTNALTLVIAAASRTAEANAPTQQLWCHPRCLGDRLAPRVPFLPDAFDD